MKKKQLDLDNGSTDEKEIESAWVCDINEANNKLGAHKCEKNDECHGKRTCSHFGWCQGESGCDDEKKDPGFLEQVEEKAEEVVVWI